MVAAPITRHPAPKRGEIVRIFLCKRRKHGHVSSYDTVGNVLYDLDHVFSGKVNDIWGKPGFIAAQKLCKTLLAHMAVMVPASQASQDKPANILRTAQFPAQHSAVVVHPGRDAQRFTIELDAKDVAWRMRFSCRHASGCLKDCSAQGEW